MRCAFIPRIVVFLHFNAHANARIYNATIDANHVVGVYPLSGQYGSLNRLLFYVLWIFILIFCCKKQTWLILGPLAYVMTCSATAAVHALVLAITSVRGLYDLDAAGAWAFLSVSATITPPIMWYSNRLRDSVYRPIFGFWSTVVGTGCICCATALFRDYPEEPDCWSDPSNNNRKTEATLLTSSTQLLTPGQFNCSYAFFNTSQPMRNPSEITVIPAVRAFGILYKLWITSCILVGLFGVCVAILGCCLASDRKRTKAESEATLATTLPRYATPRQRRYHRDRRTRARNELETGIYQGVSCRMLYINPIILPVVVAFNEAYILASRPLPSGEPLYAIGQWGNWVAVGLALMAAAINAWYNPKWERLKWTWEADQEERLQERQRKAIPQIHLDLESNPLSDEIQTPRVGDEYLGHEMAATSSHPTAQPASYQMGEGAEDHSDSSIVSVARPANVVVRREEDRTLVQGHEPMSNVTRISLRVPMARNRLNNIQYDPPFALKPDGVDLDSMFVQQYNMTCRAYDEIGTQHDGIIVRDIEGKDWVVQKGILWHRELWEQGYDCVSMS